MRGTVHVIVVFWRAVWNVQKQYPGISVKHIYTHSTPVGCDMHRRRGRYAINKINDVYLQQQGVKTRNTLQNYARTRPKQPGATGRLREIRHASRKQKQHTQNSLNFYSIYRYQQLSLALAKWKYKQTTAMPNATCDLSLSLCEWFLEWLLPFIHNDFEWVLRQCVQYMYKNCFGISCIWPKMPRKLTFLNQLNVNL